MPGNPHFHDVVVRNDQTRAEWHAGEAGVVAGLIHVPTSPSAPPADMFTRPGQTFTITGRDEAQRTRAYVSVIVERQEAGVVVFR